MVVKNTVLQFSGEWENNGEPWGIPGGLSICGHEAEMTTSGHWVPRLETTLGWTWNENPKLLIFNVLKSDFYIYVSIIWT